MQFTDRGYKVVMTKHLYDGKKGVYVFEEKTQKLVMHFMTSNEISTEDLKEVVDNYIRLREAW